MRSLVSHCGVLCASFKFWHIMIFCFISVSKIVLLHFDFRTTYLYHDLFIYTGWHVCGISISMNCYFLFLFCAIQQSKLMQNVFSAEGQMVEELHYTSLLHWMFFAIPVYFIYDDKLLSHDDVIFLFLFCAIQQSKLMQMYFLQRDKWSKSFTIPHCYIGCFLPFQCISYMMINSWVMMTSSNGNIFRVTIPLCG